MRVLLEEIGVGGDPWGTEARRAWSGEGCLGRGCGFAERREGIVGAGKRDISDDQLEHKRLQSLCSNVNYY